MVRSVVSPLLYDQNVKCEYTVNYNTLVKLFNSFTVKCITIG